MLGPIRVPRSSKRWISQKEIGGGVAEDIFDQGGGDGIVVCELLIAGSQPAGKFAGGEPGSDGFSPVFQEIGRRVCIIPPSSEGGSPIGALEPCEELFTAGLQSEGVFDQVRQLVNHDVVAMAGHFGCACGPAVRRFFRQRHAHFRADPMR